MPLGSTPPALDAVPGELSRRPGPMQFGPTAAVDKPHSALPAFPLEWLLGAGDLGGQLVKGSASPLVASHILAFFFFLNVSQSNLLPSRLPRCLLIHLWAGSCFPLSTEQTPAHCRPSSQTRHQTLVNLSPRGCAKVEGQAPWVHRTSFLTGSWHSSSG